jgi:hypothetical protein
VHLPNGSIARKVLECGDYGKTAPICFRTAFGFHFFKLLADAVPSPKPRSITAVGDCVLRYATRQPDGASSLHMGDLTGAAAIRAGLTEIFQLLATIRAALGAASGIVVAVVLLSFHPDRRSTSPPRAVRRLAHRQRRSPARAIGIAQLIVIRTWPVQLRRRDCIRVGYRQAQAVCRLGLHRDR